MGRFTASHEDFFGEMEKLFIQFATKRSAAKI
jgi:hypothetical protein